jgi:hypothetical protein
MTSAILMAGYNNKREVRKYSRTVAEQYGETFIETGYRPLREFKIVENDTEISKPMIQFLLEKLSKIDLIDEIIIVGHRMLLEQRFSEIINQLNKPCEIINQNARIPQRIVDHFGIEPKKIKYNSMAGNMIKGYAASKAFENRRHALFVASDSPLTPIEFIIDFIKTAQEHQEHSAIILPAIIIDIEEDKLGRKPLKLHNDSSHKIHGAKDRYGRQGFRLSSMMFVNLNRIDLKAINTAYSLRKMLNPKIQLQLFKVTRELGYSNLYSKYFIKKDLSIREVENITSKFFNDRLSLIPLEGEASTYDYDGTDKEYRKISEMLNKP